MWQPANKAALPSPADLKYAKKAIDELEDVLKDALAVLEQAQSRALALTKELDERKAWIAPIRKLPSELLSEIFIFGSEMEHLAPMTITEVSRLWRAVVLSTPRAWSLIYGNATKHEHHLDHYVSTFVERSNPCLLHICIRDDLDSGADSDESEYEPYADRFLSLLQSSLSRIRCLSIGSRQFTTLSEECMPNLAKLMITDSADIITPFFISRNQFPRLQSIESGCSWGGSMSLTSFPPLQELAIQINGHSTWMNVIKNCSATLKSLSLVGQLKCTERVTIIFPRLQSLTLNEWWGISEPAEWAITMVTPGLISYSELSHPASTAFRLRHDDVRSVAFLRSCHVPDLAPYIGLRVLQLSRPNSPTYLAYAGELAEQLKQDINTSPALTQVEFLLPPLSPRSPGLESTKRDVMEKIKSARPGIESSFIKEFGPMPGSIEENSCEPDMPCSYQSD